MLDQIFGENNFQNEIVWRRAKAHNDSKRYGANHDTIFFYTCGKKWTWNRQYTAYSQEYMEQNYRYKDEKGVFRVSDMTANKPGGDVSYEWTTPDGRRVTPYKGRYLGVRERQDEGHGGEGPHLLSDDGNAHAQALPRRYAGYSASDVLG